MMAFVPSNLMERYQHRDMVGNLYSINHFKLYWDPYGYSIAVSDYSIAVSESTRFTYIEPIFENPFPIYPLVPTIETLVKRPRHLTLIDVMGKVIGGRILGYNSTVELILQDRTGFVIILVLNDGPEALPFMIAKAVKHSWIIYVSRVKYRERGGMNFLFSTYLSRVAYHPDMPEAQAIWNIYG